MKGLNQFLSFDWDKFATGKVFTVTGVSEYVDYESRQHLGTKVDVVITVDKTAYHFKTDESFSNLYEKISFKVSKDVRVPLNAQVMPKGVTATIYGDFRNQLSIKCDDIAVITAPKEKE